MHTPSCSPVDLNTSDSTSHEQLPTWQSEIHPRIDANVRAESRYKTDMDTHICTPYHIRLGKNATRTTPRDAIKVRSIILAQPLPCKIGHGTRTVEIAIPRFRRQNTVGHACLPIPLSGGLGRPRPIEPSPGGFETRHLRRRVHHEPGFVGVGVGRWVGVGGGAGTGGGFGGTVGGENGDGAVSGFQGSFPASAGVDVVEVCGAVGVGLGPFAAEGGPEAVRPMSGRLSTPVCQRKDGELLTHWWYPRSTSSGPSTQYKHTAPSPYDSYRSN